MPDQLQPTTADAIDLAADAAAQRRRGPLRPGRPGGEHAPRLPVGLARVHQLVRRAHGLEALPATAAAITGYLTDLAGHGAKVGTMSRRLSAIRFAHRLRDLPDPTENARVVAVWEGIRRTHTTRPEQATPLMPPQLWDVLDACPTTKTWKDKEPTGRAEPGRPPGPGADPGRVRRRAAPQRARRPRRRPTSPSTPTVWSSSSPGPRPTSAATSTRSSSSPAAPSPAAAPSPPSRPGSTPPASPTGPCSGPSAKATAPSTGGSPPASVNTIVQTAVDPRRAGRTPARTAATPPTASAPGSSPTPTPAAPPTAPSPTRPGTGPCTPSAPTSASTPPGTTTPPPRWGCRRSCVYTWRLCPWVRQVVRSALAYTAT